MDALTHERPLDLQRLFEPGRPSQGEAEAAVRTLIRWAGDDPEREGLLETPGRVLRGGGAEDDGGGRGRGGGDQEGVAEQGGAVGRRAERKTHRGRVLGWEMGDGTAERRGVGHGDGDGGDCAFVVSPAGALSAGGGSCVAGTKG